jgi:hypothetical protein
MNSKRIFKLGTLIVAVLFIVQLGTYNFIAIEQLENKLLDETFNPNTYSEVPFDSAFVRDFIVLDCGNVTETYHSHHLVDKQDKLKSKLGVKFIEFQNPLDYEWRSAYARNYKLVYLTWVCQYPWNLKELFKASQVEELHINKNKHSREITYTWVLFFWVKSFEHVESIYRLK